jgi:serine/threonine protein kinase
MIHAGSMASIFRLTGADGPLPLVMKIPRLGPGERAVNVIGYEVCRTVLGALAQGRHHPTLIAHGDVETTPYLVMEFVEGTRLNDWLDRAPMSPEEIARLGSAMAIALHEIHQQDVVHLDLKPTNVVFRPSGEAVLIDFGLARHGHYPDLLAEELRIPLGNWVYMAPEQLRGVRCDPRSDIYALGGILYELATGRLPFGHPSTIAELRRRLYRDPVPPRALVPATPAWLQEIILRCLEVDARARYATAGELAQALSAPQQVAITERGARTRRAGILTLARRRMRAARFEPAPCPPPRHSRNSRASSQSRSRRRSATSGYARRCALRRAARSPQTPTAAWPASRSSRPQPRSPARARRIRPPVATSGAWSSCAVSQDRWTCPTSASRTTCSNRTSRPQHWSSMRR